MRIDDDTEQRVQSDTVTRTTYLGIAGIRNFGDSRRQMNDIANKIKRVTTARFSSRYHGRCNRASKDWIFSDIVSGEL